jgi:hypothetical protein
MHRRTFAFATTLMTNTMMGLLSACGGGGADSASSGPPATSFNAALDSVSYNNFKAVGLQPTRVPQSSRFNGIRGYGNFFADGRASLFVARLTYNVATTTPSTASPAVFEFWSLGTNGNYTLDPLKISSGSGCIHPRKAVVADFNHDGRPDIVVACHGHDAAPFAGERMKIVLSESDGRYRIADAANDIGFFHGVTAGDIDGDGWADLVAVNSMESATAIVFLNQKDGSFKRDGNARLPNAVAGKQYFTVELLDVNGDGKADLFFGGHEWERSSATVVLLNPGNGNFLGVVPTTIPAVANEGVVLDVTTTGTGNNRALWVLRTSGGDGTFYVGRTVQRLSWPGLASSIVYANRSTPWTTWLIPATVAGVPSLSSDDLNDGIVIAQ